MERSIILLNNQNIKGLLLSWDDDAWNDYLQYLYQNRKYIKRINRLIKSIHRDGILKGIGNPEILKHYKGLLILSRRITKGYRLVYVVHKPFFIIESCRYHYGKN